MVAEARSTQREAGLDVCRQLHLILHLHPLPRLVAVCLRIQQASDLCHRLRAQENLPADLGDLQNLCAEAVQRLQQHKEVAGAHLPAANQLPAEHENRNANREEDVPHDPQRVVGVGVGPQGCPVVVREELAEKLHEVPRLLIGANQGLAGDVGAHVGGPVLLGLKTLAVQRHHAPPPDEERDERTRDHDRKACRHDDGPPRHRELGEDLQREDGLDPQADERLEHHERLDPHGLHGGLGVCVQRLQHVARIEVLARPVRQLQRGGEDGRAQAQARLAAQPQHPEALLRHVLAER
mmetsp:Transcript_96652/g.268775  ORF Transcript_96652/g.268775 Transcript_96652/m.268775 type:complete len:295 (+) Transcript_96652:501-1385(+)